VSSIVCTGEVESAAQFRADLHTAALLLLDEWYCWMNGAEERKETQVIRLVLSLALVRHVMLFQYRPLVFRGYPGSFKFWNDEWIGIKPFGRRK